jgi:hypothetical protein
MKARGGKWRSGRPSTAVIAWLDRATQYAEAYRFITTVSGMLDPAFAPLSRG